MQWHNGRSRPSDKGGGGGHPDPEIRGGGLKTIFFQPFRPQFGPKIRGERAPQAPSLDPPLWCSYHKSICIFTNYCTLQVTSHPWKSNTLISWQLMPEDHFLIPLDGDV